MTQKQVSTQNQNTNFQVFIRIRPNNENELLQSSCVNILSQREISMCENQKGQSPAFSFDHIFDSGSTQQEIYRQVTNNMIDNAFNGINGTIFCYGQTCSGKTHTCVGSKLQDQKQKGLVPRIIQQILQKTEECPRHIEFKMKISIVQIYNQKIKDLLNQSKTNIKIRSDKSRGVFLHNVTQKYILSKQEAKYYISKGIQKRTSGVTGMNSFSSRSHLLFIISVYQHNLYTGEARKAKITLVDLAGTEKLSRVGSEGKILQQTKKINTSLSTLGKVINILSDGKNSHVPYRDSKLTRLLQQSLGGNSITKLIINVSNAKINYQQTLSSLRFGFRAKAIKNQPKINKQYTVPELLQLLNKAQRKIKILTQVIKQIMKEKGNETITFKQFVKMYLLDPLNGYQSNQSEDASPGQIGRSFSNRISFKSTENILDQRYYKPASIRSNDSGLKSRQKNIKLIPSKTKKQSLLSPQKVLKAHKSVSKPIKNKNNANQFTPKLLFKNKWERVQSSKKDNDFLSQRDFKEIQTDRYSNIIQCRNKKECENAKNKDILSSRSIGGSICSLNSRVLDLSFKNSFVPQIKTFKLELNQVLSADDNPYNQNSIEFNILKIKQNFKRIENLRLKALIS